MARGDNRRTKKTRRRKAQAKKKGRIQARKKAGKASKTK